MVKTVILISNKPNNFFFVLCSKSSQNEIRNEIKSDQVEFSSSDDEIVRSSNKSVIGENSKSNSIFCKNVLTTS